VPCRVVSYIILYYINLGALTLLDPSGPAWPVMGVLYLLYYIIYTVCLLHVSATILAILREVNYTEYIAILFEPAHKYKRLSYKMYDLKYTL
jgi:hypothetical protein